MEVRGFMCGGSKVRRFLRGSLLRGLTCYTQLRYKADVQSEYGVIVHKVSIPT